MKQHPEICPRCESNGPEALSHSPVEQYGTGLHYRSEEVQPKL
jgi:hypothetical protein